MEPANIALIEPALFDINLNSTRILVGVVVIIILFIAFQLRPSSLELFAMPHRCDMHDYPYSFRNSDVRSAAQYDELVAGQLNKTRRRLTDTYGERVASDIAPNWDLPSTPVAWHDADHYSLHDGAARPPAAGFRVPFTPDHEPQIGGLSFANPNMVFA